MQWHKESCAQSNSRNPAKADRISQRNQFSADSCWQQLTEVGIRQRHLSSDADTGKEASDDQCDRIRADGARQSENGIYTQIQQKCGPPAEAVGDHSHERRPEKHTQEARPKYHRQCRLTEAE